MAYLATCGDGASGLATSVVGVLALMVLGSAGGGVDTGANVTPSTVVQGFFLTPEKISIGVFVKVGCDLGNVDE